MEGKSEAERTLDWIASLPEDWDGEGSPAISGSLVRVVCEVVRTLPRVPFIAPTGRGSIQLEYEDDGLGYLEFDLSNDGRVHEMYRDASQVISAKTIELGDIGGEVRQSYASSLKVV